MAKKTAQNTAEVRQVPEPTTDPLPTGNIDSDQRFLDMIRDHMAMGSATEADLAEWKRRLGK